MSLAPDDPEPDDPEPDDPMRDDPAPDDTAPDDTAPDDTVAAVKAKQAQHTVAKPPTDNVRLWRMDTLVTNRARSGLGQFVVPAPYGSVDR